MAERDRQGTATVWKSQTTVELLSGLEATAIFAVALEGEVNEVELALPESVAFLAASFSALSFLSLRQSHLLVALLFAMSTLEVLPFALSDLWQFALALAGLSIESSLIAFEIVKAMMLLTDNVVCDPSTGDIGHVRVGDNGAKHGVGIWESDGKQESEEVINDREAESFELLSHVDNFVDLGL